jgi:hypothetical protein
LDPIYFQHDLRVEYTQVGAPHGPEGFSERADDWCSTVYWYQNVTGRPLPSLPDRGERVARISPAEWEAAAIARMRSGEDRRNDRD